jgi:hypothetical protein
MSRLAACLLAATILGAAMPAAAAANDLELWRLGSPRETLGDGTPNPFYSTDAQARFEALAMQLGLALSSVTGGPARTTGAAGFAVGLEWASLSVPADRTLGDRAVWPVASDQPSNSLSMPAAHVRKGLPYSFELGARLAEIQDSGMLGATLELRAAVVEGVPLAPDVSIRVHGGRLLGARDLSLATGGVDLCVSKEFPVLRTLQIAPYAGWDPTLVFASSTAIDFDPSAEALDNPALDDAVFDTYTALHHRIYGGARLAWGPATVALEYSRAAAGQDSVSGFSVATGLAF